MGKERTPRGEPPYTARLHRLEDAAEQAMVQQLWTRLDCQQLFHGKFKGGLGVVELGGIRVVREFQNATTNKVGGMAGNLRTLSIVEQAAPAMRFSQFGHGVGRHVFFLPMATEVDILIPGGTGTLYVALDQNHLIDRLECLAPGNWTRRLSGISVFDTGLRDSFVDTMVSLFDMVSTQLGRGVVPDVERMERLVLDTAAFTLGARDARSWEGDPRRPSGPRIAQTMRLARAYIHECLERRDLPTVVDMCARVGVSERTRQYSFRDQVGMPPVAYLRVTRLNQARLDLTRPPPGTTVTDVAMRWGFLHLGHFSKAYRDLFDETPRETLARGMRRLAR